MRKPRKILCSKSRGKFLPCQTTAVTADNQGGTGQAERYALLPGERFFFNGKLPRWSMTCAGAMWAETDRLGHPSEEKQAFSHHHKANMIEMPTEQQNRVSREKKTMRKTLPEVPYLATFGLCIVTATALT